MYTYFRKKKTIITAAKPGKVMLQVKKELSRN